MKVKGRFNMRKLPELDIFITHYDWYTKDAKGYFVPTEEAPKEAVKAMNYCNELTKRDIENDENIL